MSKLRRRLVRGCAALAAAVALMSLVSPAASAHECPPGPGGENHHTVLISFAANKYATAELGYGGGLYGMVRAARDNPGPWEDWTFCSFYEGGTKVTYIYNEANGRYVSAEFGRTGGDHGMLRARATSVGPWEKFRVERWGPNPNMYTIRSLRNGRYVSTELGYGGVRKWEKYYIPCSQPPHCSF
jgi:hypothetical protein